MAYSGGGVAQQPRVVILVSGKRKSGKDFVSEVLCDCLGESSYIFRLSAPLKRGYADTHGLDLSQLMGTGGYKETHRKNMIGWGKEVRERDPTYFCRLVQLCYNCAT